MNSGGSPRDRVIDATLRLATRREFSDVTLTDIAQEAGISLADLRELFPSKGAIIGAFSRRVDREVLDALPKDASHEPARERLYDVLRRRLDVLEPDREALASVGRWAARDPLTAAALNRETVNSMRFMLEAADVDSEGPVGSLKLQGLALAWSRVLEDWFAGDIHDALSTLDRELTRGERYVDRAEDFARLTRPFYSFAQSLFGWRPRRVRDHDDDSGYPHAGA
ncbi:TetR family transcriptional regulator [Methylocystis sp.]|jgi:AcrR family transcriptional regulator|uniref:TetR family transcriptional regulator n=1 Tax=Methylocystis sp. TaxID=1911079 RepID=UPI0025CD73DE|nr:TetR family transcriptional regulator [Methylocystis sp.]